MHWTSGVPLSLYGRDGRRKYLTPSERSRFIAVAMDWPRPEIGTLCLMLAYTGCRISEALALRAASVEIDEGFIAIRSLKKRGGLLVIREIPVPPDFLTLLGDHHQLDTADPADRLWPISRTQAWVQVKRVMQAARITDGPHAVPKGLRHAFGIHALRSGVPLNLVQRWLGHSSLATTAIYAQALGDEERELAARMWQS